jgi:hypothetical protein
MCTMAFRARRLVNLGFMTAFGVSAGLLLSAPARADELPKEEAGDKKEEAGDKKEEAGDKKEAPKDGGSKKDASPNDPREDPLKRYYFLGLRVRDIVVPQFMMELFSTGGATGNVWMIGPEFTTRKDRTEVDISLMYADYGYGPAMFKGKNDADIGYEIITSDMKLVYLTFDLLIDVPLDDKGMFSFLIGGGIGVGVVAGDLHRVQAYPSDGGAADPQDPTKWTPCTGAGDGFGGYCDNGNNHYETGGRRFSEPSWIDGGSKPAVFPWLSIPQLSFRAKPIKQLQIRADVGFSITGFFFGLSSGYGF